MTTQGNKTLAEATLFVLEKTNGTILRNPQLFRNSMADLLEPNSVELRVLLLACQAPLLEPYALFLEGSLDADVAGARAEHYLVYKCVVAEEAARKVTQGISDGVMAYTGRASSPRRGPQRSGAAVATPSVGQQGGAQHSDADVRGPSPMAIQEPPALVGEARWRGTVDGIEYAVDQRSFSTRGLTGALRLHSNRSDAVSVTVVSQNQSGGHPNDTCRNLPSGGLGLIVFASSVTGIDRISVKVSRGLPPSVRLAWSARRNLGQDEDSVELRIANVTAERARISRIVVTDDANADIVFHKLGKQALESGADTRLSFSIARGHAFGVYVDGVRLMEGVTETISTRKGSVASASSSRVPSQGRASKSNAGKKAPLIGIAVVVALVIAFGFLLNSRGKDVFSRTDASATDASTTDATATDADTTSSQETASYAPPSDFPNPYEGTYGTWQDGVYESETLGIRIEPTNGVAPDYEAVANAEEDGSQPVDCAYKVGSGDVVAHMYVGPWNFTTYGDAGIGGSTISVGEDEVTSGYELVDFCGREWWKAEAYSENDGYGVIVYLAETEDGRVQLNLTVIGDPSAADTLLAAVKPLSEG